MNAREGYLRALYTVSKNTPPDVWDKFKEALTVYVSDQIEKVIGARFTRYPNSCWICSIYARVQRVKLKILIML